VDKVDKRRSAFTLIELLVVIAIIAILAAILFPIYLTAKRKAKLTKCMGNMAQIGKAMMMYADDHGGALPFAWCEENWVIWYRGTWRERIQPYVKSRNVLICPVKTKAPRYPPPAYPDCGHYGMNVYVTMNDAATYYVGWRPLGSIPAPTKTILVTENYDGDWSGEPLDNQSTGIEGQFYPYHDDDNRKGGEFVFCDGHAGFMSVYTTQEMRAGIKFYYWKVQKK